MSLPFPNKTIHQLFEEQVENAPEKIALLFEEQQLTYRELNRRANQLAHYLTTHHDIRPDTLIGMSLERGVECIVSMLAILKAGAAYVPLDPGYPKERLQFMLQDTNADIILATEDLVPRLPATGKHIVIADSGRYNDFPASNLRTPVEPHHLAYVLYTSGTTGRPKGVMVEHCNVVQLVKNQPGFKIGSQDVMAQCSTINFDAATFEIWAALLNGIALSVLSQKTILSSQFLKTAIQQNSITICMVTSALFEQLVSHDTALFAGLNYLFVVGDVLNYSTVDKVLADNEHRPKAILNGYGPTETTTFATTCHIPEDCKTRQGAVPIGLPLHHTQVNILDDCLQPVPVGTVGEIYIGGAGVARGYLNLADATQQKFVANPFATSDEKNQGRNLRLYRSGDLARYLADGNIEFMGRRDQQVKIRGFRIECGEVEQALLSSDRIVQAVVRPVEHCGEKQLVAYYVPKRSTFSDSPGESENQAEALTSCTAQSGMSRQDLQEYLQARLPEYMIPQHFVPLNMLPLTPNGKLDVSALPALQTFAALKSTAFIAPSNRVEAQLVALWSEVLGQKGIGIHDDFFELGGSSLLAMQLVSTINRELNVEVSVPDLFDLKNVEAMAKAIALFASKDLPEKQRHGEVSQDEATESETLILRDYFLSEFKLTYNESFVVELEQPATFGEFHHAVDALMSECEVLHTTYICEEGRYRRRINKNSSFECDYSDLSYFVDSDAEFLDRINALVKKEFDISQDKLIRFYLFKLSQGRCKIFVAFFHALLDGTSIHILCKSLVQRIRLGVGHTDGKLPGSDMNDFYLLGSKIRERYGIGKDTEGESRNGKIAYWHDFFNRFEYCSVSPTPDSSNSRLGRQEVFVIESDVKEMLFALSKKLHISLFDVVFGCFMLLLNKFTQQNSIAVRTVIDERLYGPQYAQTLGCFVNNLFLGVEIAADTTLSDLLIASKRAKDQAIRNALSYDTLVEHFREKIIDLSRIHFNLELRGSNELDSYASQIQTHSGQVKCDLYVELDVKKDKILARVEYKSASFDKNFIDSLIQCYTHILKNVDLFSNQPIKCINILPDAQYHKVIHSFNPDKIYPCENTIHQTFEEQAKKNPKQIALSCNGTLLTYADLNARANRLAHYLLQHDCVVPGSLITLCMEKSEQFLIAILAVLKVGAAYVPIDPHSPQDRIRYMLDDTDSRIILINSVHRQKIELITQQGKTDIFAIDDPIFAENLSKQPIKNPDVTVSNAEVAYVIYTSGTTGNPKGVMQNHYNAVRLFAATDDIYRFTKDDIWILFHSCVFDFSIWEMWGALFYGGKLIIPSEEQIKDPNLLYQLCYHERVTVLNQTPRAFYQFMDVAIHKEKLPLKYVVFGGEALDVRRLKPWVQYYGCRQPMLVNMYGITETTVHTTYKEISREDVEQGSASIGKTLPDMRAFVLDANMLPVPLGATGELYVGGAGLARRYLNKPQLTLERFGRNPFQGEDEHARLYKTGDVVRWLPDGELAYVGRNDQQVKIRGFRVELDDIANNLLEHPFISEAVVLAVEDQESGKYLAAYFVEGESAAKKGVATFGTSVVHLRQFLQTRLPGYMVPASYTKCDSIPLTVQGKVDKKNLLALTNKSFGHSANYMPPRTRDEIALAEIWAKVLKVDSSAVGVNDDFFALGGHSLLVTSLMAQIQAKFNVDLQVRDLFIKSTIQGLLSIIDQRSASISLQAHDLRSAIDFDAEAILPDDFYPDEAEYSHMENPQNIFLTGVNGFLGGYLLEELLNKTTATIYCLVRAASSVEAERKLFASLNEKGLSIELVKHRIVALPGDLAQPRFALPEETFALLTKKIDVIYHNGAAVNFLYPYEFLKAANVDSVKEVLRLAKTGRLKPVHYISTLAVFSSLHLKKSITVINEDQPVDFGDQLFMGYPETKWVAEKLLGEAKKRGFPVCIYRFMEVTGHGKTGFSNKKSLDMAYLKGCIEMGLIWDLPMKKYYAPVDFLAQAIVYLSQQAASTGKNFHIQNSNPINQIELVEILNDLGFPVEFAPYDVWVQKIIQDPQNPLYIYKPLWTEKWTEENITVIEMFTEQRRPQYGCENALSGLAGSGLICPKIDREYMRRCLRYLINTGYIRESNLEVNHR